MGREHQFAQQQLTVFARILVIISASLFANCSQLSPATVHPAYTCSTCSTGHYLTNTFTCQVISSTCASFNHSTQFCDICATGHMLNSSKPSECLPVFESDTCKTYDRLSRCRECKDATKFPVMYKDANSRFHIKCVPNSLGGRLASATGLFGFADNAAPEDRSLAIYDEACLANDGFFLSLAPNNATGLKLVDDNGK